MNNKSRKNLREACVTFEELLERVEAAEDIKTMYEEITRAVDENYTTVDIEAIDERMKFDNLPEGLQHSEKGEAIEEAADNLEEAVGSLDELRDDIKNFTDNPKQKEYIISDLKSTINSIKDACGDKK